MSWTSRTSKASLVSPGELFNFKKSIEIDGGTLGTFKINEKRHGVYKIKAWQDLNDGGKLTKTRNLIFKGRIYDQPNNDDLINFAGRIKIHKYTNSYCEKNCSREDKNLLDNDDNFKGLVNKSDDCCTFNCYEGSYSELTLRNNISGEKYHAEADTKFEYNPEVIPNDEIIC